jgi:hypothetical protein
MNDFRKKTPINRSAPKAVKKYGEYKKDLKDDFFSKCGYCNGSDHWTGGWRFFQIDHFVPKKHLITISETEYSNLVYSCFFCNNAKRAKWPSGNENIHNDGKTGFIFPKEDEYGKYLKRDSFGNIISDSDLGKYMIKAMKLGLKRHGIIWNLEKLEEIIDQIEVEYDKNKDKIPLSLSNKLNTLFFEHRKYSKLLRKEGDA